MKPVISPEYAALNKQLHAGKSEFGCDTAEATQDAAGVVKFARKVGGTSILDYGCGKGALKPAILRIAPDMTVLEFDPAIESKDTLPTSPVDVIAAMDVMEHIEPEYLDSVLNIMRDLEPKLVIMKIALTPAEKTLADGRNAHILLRTPEWWMEKLQQYFMPRNAQKISELHFMFLGTPRA